MTTWEPIESVGDVVNPDVVKIVVDENDECDLFLALAGPVSA